MTTREESPADGVLAVLIVCAHRLEAEGLRLALERDEGLAVVGWTRDATEALGQASRHRADIVVVGWGWRDRECIDVLTRLTARDGGPPVLVVSADVRPSHVRKAIEAGATAFLPADVDPDELIYNVRAAADAEDMILHHTLVPAFLSHVASGPGPEASGTFESLTAREQDVVRLVAQGLMDRDIGQALFISVRTVQTHLSHIYAKLGVHTRTEVALMAVRAGWTPLPPKGAAALEIQ